MRMQAACSSQWWQASRRSESIGPFSFPAQENTLSHVNELGQPIGDPVANWQPAVPPPQSAMHGRSCTLVPLDASAHGADLFTAFSADLTGRNWTYLPYGPFADEASFTTWLSASAQSRDPLYHAVIDVQSGRAIGVASYLRIEPASGVIEVGHIHFSPHLQRTPLASEAMYLMMRRVFDELGYRRYEWKCDALNEPSRRAAERLGFSYEGTFQQAVMYKGRNRDTAWFSIIDKEWPAIRTAFENWLAQDNFDADGRQRTSLATPRGVRS